MTVFAYSKINCKFLRAGESVHKWQMHNFLSAPCFNDTKQTLGTKLQGKSVEVNAFACNQRNMKSNESNQPTKTSVFKMDGGLTTWQRKAFCGY